MLVRSILITWASPTTVVALLFGIVGMPFGTRIRRKGHTLEIYGGLVTWLLERTPVNAAAMTLGHVVFGRSVGSLNFCREHELVHVRQYERRGPLFVPLYLFFSAVMWFRGKHPYYDNPFEREAYGEDHPHYRQQRDE